jgi:hypothetical protein
MDWMSPQNSDIETLTPNMTTVADRAFKDGTKSHTRLKSQYLQSWGRKIMSLKPTWTTQEEPASKKEGWGIRTGMCQSVHTILWSTGWDFSFLFVCFCFFETGSHYVLRLAWNSLGSPDWPQTQLSCLRHGPARSEFIKVKNEAFKRWQEKFRDQCKTDCYAWKCFVIQDKKKSNMPKSSILHVPILVSVLPKQALQYTSCNHHTPFVRLPTPMWRGMLLCEVYTHALPQYGMKAGLTNYGM